MNKRRGGILDIEPGPEKGRSAARYFGSECEANPGSTFRDYRDDIANYYGYLDWWSLPDEWRAESVAVFEEGRKAERELNSR